MEPGLWIAALVLVASAVIALVILFLRFKFPLRSTLRSCIGIIVLLTGELAVPNISGAARLSVNWGDWIQIQEGSITFSGTSDWLNVVAFLCVTALIGLCLLRLAGEREVMR